MGFPGYEVDAKDDTCSLAAYTVCPSVEVALTSRHLAVVALAQTSCWQTARGQIEYNLTHLRQGVRQIIQALES
jgi:hypothetical protein